MRCAATIRLEVKGGDVPVLAEGDPLTLVVQVDGGKRFQAETTTVSASSIVVGRFFFVSCPEVFPRASVRALIIRKPLDNPSDPGSLVGAPSRAVEQTSLDRAPARWYMPMTRYIVCICVTIPDVIRCRDRR